MTYPSGPSYAEMRDVALLGGGFDPITSAHEELGKIVHAKTNFPVWMMPCFQHLYGKELASPLHRFHMVDLVANQYRSWMYAFDFEIQRKHSGSMYETFRNLQIQYPKTKFHIVIGTDNANDIEEKWDRGAALIAEVPFIVVGRKGKEAKCDWFLKPPHLYLELDYEMSSTDIREAIETGRYEWAAMNLNYEVWDYIQQHGLYGHRG